MLMRFYIDAETGTKGMKQALSQCSKFQTKRILNADIAGGKGLDLLLEDDGKVVISSE